MAASVLLALYALAGYVLLPWYVERRLPARLNERLPEQIAIGAAEFDPFLLRFEARNVVFRAEDGASRVEIERLLADLGWTSLVQRTWVLDELRLAGVAAHVEVQAGADDSGAASADAEPQDAAAAPQENGLPAVRVEDFALEDGHVTVVDARGAETARLALGPVSARASGITTVEEASPGHFELRAGLPEGGSVTVTGSLAPVATSAEGKVAVSGLRLSTLWPFVAERLALAPPQGALAASGSYRWSRSPDGPTLVLDGLDAQLDGLVLAPPDTDAEPLLALETVAAHDGRFELDARRLVVPELAAASGTLRLVVDASGRLNWSTLARESETPDAAGEPWQVNLEQVGVKQLALHYADRRPAGAQIVTVDALEAGFGLRLTTGEQTTLAVVDASGQARGVALTRPDTEAAARVAAVALEGGRYDSDTQRLAADTIVVREGRVEVLRDAQGALGVAGIATGADGDTADTPAPTNETGEPLRYAIGKLRIEDFALAYADRSFEPTLTYRTSLSAELSNIDRAASAPIDFEAGLTLEKGGRLQASGTLAQDLTRADAQVRLERFALPPLQPVLGRYAALELVSGALAGRADVRYTASERPRLRADGRLALENFRVDEAASGDRFLSAAALTTHGTLTLEPGLLRLEEIEVREPGAKLVISEAGEFNLVQVLRKPPGEEDAPAAEGEEDAPAAEGDAVPRDEPPFEAHIARVRLTEGVVDFADYSLVLPFSTQVQHFNGTAVGIDTRADSPAALEAEGRIEPFGSARVTGSLRPRAPTEFTDIRVSFDNVPMPPLSPYTATFAGRKVAAGRLWLDLQYRIIDGHMEGRNEIALDDFRLGERVEAASAMDLPLDLAVALLKNDKGRIDIAVPVEGNVNDPQFDYAAVIRAALARTVQRIVTAPFRLLARLAGRERAEDLQEIEFEPGSDRLQPAEEEDLLAVAEALEQRPQLALTVGGPYDPGRDARALRAQQVRRALARQLGRELAPDETPGPFDFSDPATRRALHALVEAMPAAAGTAHPASAPSDSAAGLPPPAPPGEDPAAPFRAMFERLVERWPLGDQALRLLAVSRAQAIRAFLVEQGGVAPGRVTVGEIHAVQAGEEGVPAHLEVAVDDAQS